MFFGQRRNCVYSLLLLHPALKETLGVVSGFAHCFLPKEKKWEHGKWSIIWFALNFHRSYHVAVGQ